MTFTFSADLSTDLALVRFHIGDTDADGYYLTDETITALLTSEGSVGGAVIACIKYIITQLSKPNFKLDWMSVSDMQEARKGYERLLITKAQEFGIKPTSITISTTISTPYRADSGQDSDEDTYDGTTL
jgi:hypothetical protein